MWQEGYWHIFLFFFFLSVDFIFKLEGLLLLLILSLTYGAVFSLINLYGKIHSTASYFQKIKIIDIKFWSGFKANSSLSQSTLPFNFATNFILVKFRLYKIMLNCYVHWVKKNKKKKNKLENLMFLTADIGPQQREAAESHNICALRWQNWLWTEGKHYLSAGCS